MCMGILKLFWAISFKEALWVKSMFSFISFAIGKDKSIYDLASLKILDTQSDPYLAWLTSKNHSEIKLF
jgi:hypothetical protein